MFNLTYFVTSTYLCTRGEKSLERVQPDVFRLQRNYTLVVSGV